MAIVRLTKIISDVDLSKSDRGISGTSDREGLYQEYSEQIKEKHYSSPPRPAIKLLKGSISQGRFPLMMVSVLGLGKIQAQTAELGPHIESYSVGICWSYVVLRL
jgi:hypothetical protein